MENEPLSIAAQWSLGFSRGALVETTVDDRVFRGRRDELTLLVDPETHNLITAAIREAFQRGRVPIVTRTVFPIDPEVK